MTSHLATIVSDAQAGAARGALDAAIELDLPFGGWAPRGIGVPEIYRERVRWAPSVELAARLNVQDSDGTLIVSFAAELEPGSPAEHADAAAERQHKPLLHIVLPAGVGSTIPEDVRRAVLDWLAEERITVLHVTGPLEGWDVGIQQAVRDALVWILEDEVSGMPRAARERTEAFAGAVIAPMIDATFAGVDRTAAPPEIFGLAIGDTATTPSPRDPVAKLPDAEIVRIAAELAEAGGRPTHIAINPANVDIARAAGLEVTIVPAGHPDVLRPITPHEGADHAQQEPSPAPRDASRRARPGVREEDGDPADGGQGVRESGQGARRQDPQEPEPVIADDDDPYGGMTPWPHPNEADEA